MRNRDSELLFLPSVPEQSRRMPSGPAHHPPILRSESRAIAEVPLPPRRGTVGPENRRHQRMHTPPDVLWPARATRKLGLSALRKRDRTIPPKTRAENPHQARHQVPPLRSAGVRRRIASGILRDRVQRTLHILLASEMWQSSWFLYSLFVRLHYSHPEAGRLSRDQVEG